VYGSIQAKIVLAGNPGAALTTPEYAPAMATMNRKGNTRDGMNADGIRVIDTRLRAAIALVTDQNDDTDRARSLDADGATVTALMRHR
jgi:hypothetical protein